MFTLIAPAVLAGLPGAYQLDFGPLAKAVPPYKYVIVLSFKGEPDVRIPCFKGRQFKPTELVDGLLISLNDPRWKLKQNGERITIYGYDDVPIQKVTVEGDGPKPAVRRVFALPPAIPKK